MNQRFTILEDNNHYTIFGWLPNGFAGVTGKLSPFPGSPSIWVSHQLVVKEVYREQGYSKQYNQRMLEHAWFVLDASAVVCSVKKDNDTQHDRLNKLGWEPISRALWIIRPPTEWSNV